MKKLLLLPPAISLIFFSNLAFTTFAMLNTREVEVIKEIWEKFGIAGKKGWASDANPCTEKAAYTENFVSCDLCPSESNSSTCCDCHVFKVNIQSENISTSLPSEFAKLPYLQLLDLSRNYLSGTIPSEWVTMRGLTNLTLMGNRLSGPIALTRMTSLKNLNLEGNRFYGPIPKEIANLRNLDKLVLSSNDFTGELPATMATLTNLTDVRISDNTFTGKIPILIGRWRNIKKLHIQGCSFEGPIPSSISALTELEDLRITDLKRGVSTFPPLEELSKLRKLILRNCYIHGPIPQYIGLTKNLETLDLSFNNFEGQIPSSFSDQLGYAKHIYLAQNNLSGSMPGWVLSSSKDVDVSYNHFTLDASPRPNKCARRLINVVESYDSASSSNNFSRRNIEPKDFPCNMLNAQQQIHSLYINCGGEDININGIKYEGDASEKGATPYYDRGNWAFSSMGNFLDDKHDDDTYVLSESCNLLNISTSDSALYKSARRTAISLTYYGLCLVNGNYTVRLHFAEIVFTQDNSYNSLGKRIFDVYVQGELKLKNFDIVKEAGGPSRAVIKTYFVNVKSNTLKIQLYWAGKGTTGIPSRGHYGPIISAISVTPNFKPSKSGIKFYGYLLVGAAGGGISILLLVFCTLCTRGYIKGGRELRGSDLQGCSITLRQLESATNNFDPINILGQGGFGVVYMGLLSDGTKIAVKQLSLASSSSSMSTEIGQDFVNEVGILSTLSHPNLVKLYGCCSEGGQMSLIFEYMENNSLSQALLEGNQLLKQKLTWAVRYKICLGIAQGLIYLHQGSSIIIVHRDIKASNVLLDRSWNAKISDFGLAKSFDKGKIHVTTTVKGTAGYIAPEYAMRRILTPAADIFSFGALALEIVSGKSCNTPMPGYGSYYLSEVACMLNKPGGCLLDLVDEDLGDEYSEDEALKIMKVALLCVRYTPDSRPTISQANDMIEGRTDIQEFINRPPPPPSSDKMMESYNRAVRDEIRPENSTESD